MQDGLKVQKTVDQLAAEYGDSACRLGFLKQHGATAAQIAAQELAVRSREKAWIEAIRASHAAAEARMAEEQRSFIGVMEADQEKRKADIRDRWNALVSALWASRAR